MPLHRSVSETSFELVDHLPNRDESLESLMSEESVDDEAVIKKLVMAEGVEEKRVAETENKAELINRLMREVQQSIPSDQLLGELHLDTDMVVRGDSDTEEENAPKLMCSATVLQTLRVTRSKLEDSEIEKSDLQKQLGGYHDQIEQQNNTVESMRDKITRLEKELRAKDEEKTKLDELLQSAAQEKLNLTSALEEREKVVTSQEAKISEMKCQISEHDTASGHLIEQIAEVERKKQEILLRELRGAWGLLSTSISHFNENMRSRGKSLSNRAKILASIVHYERKGTDSLTSYNQLFWKRFNQTTLEMGCQPVKGRQNCTEHTSIRDGKLRTEYKSMDKVYAICERFIENGQLHNVHTDSKGVVTNRVYMRIFINGQVLSPIWNTFCLLIRPTSSASPSTF
uniref:Uncharacterized protein n=1 Tax=Caenorhabditis japonica TaxID=281687 RepID=A0A8R1HP80_CAEJA